MLRGAEKEENKEDQKMPGPPTGPKAQPPPRPPSTYLTDKPRLGNKLGSIDGGAVAEEMGKGKGAEPKTSKGKEDSEGKGKSQDEQKGSNGKQSEDAESSYPNRTAYEKDWGLAKDNQQ